MKKDHAYFMTLAMKLALKAKGMTSPNPLVGALVVKNGRIIGRGFHKKAGFAHAEVVALDEAGEKAKGATLYVTLEPCPMCAGAIVLSRIPLLIFGAYDPKAGACSSLYTITNDTRLNHRVHTIGGILEEECGSVLKDFFKLHRLRKD